MAMSTRIAPAVVIYMYIIYYYIHTHTLSLAILKGMERFLKKRIHGCYIPLIEPKDCNHLKIMMYFVRHIIQLELSWNGQQSNDVIIALLQKIYNVKGEAMSCGLLVYLVLALHMCEFKWKTLREQCSMY